MTGSVIFSTVPAFCAPSSRSIRKDITDSGRPLSRKRFNSPNDVIIGPDGAIYFTDPTLDLVRERSRRFPSKACIGSIGMAKYGCLQKI